MSEAQLEEMAKEPSADDVVRLQRVKDEQRSQMQDALTKAEKKKRRFTTPISTPAGEEKGDTRGGRRTAAIAAAASSSAEAGEHDRGPDREAINECEQ